MNEEGRLVNGMERREEECRIWIACWEVEREVNWDAFLGVSIWEYREVRSALWEAQEGGFPNIIER